MLEKALLEEPKTMLALEEVRKMYMAMLDIRNRRETERLRDWFKFKAKETETELKVMRDYPEYVPADIMATKEKLVMLWTSLYSEAARRLKP